MIAPRRPPSSRPFLAAPRIDFYHPSRAIDAALHGLERAVRRSEGIGLVVGQPGTGKTLLLAKLAEQVRDDFDVALLSGARICTRRALWQSVLAEIGEPYRGIDEGELRLGVVERVRGLASTGSGLVILVDEAHTLPTRLLEELRLLTNIPTPLPAVHVVLAGTTEMEERLGTPRMESLAQRIGVRFYLEPLDHAETMSYLRAQMRIAGQSWDAVFERGADDAVFAATDGVPRLINQLCDLALVQASEAGRTRIGATRVAAAWRDIQRLPSPSLPAAGEDPHADAGDEFDGPLPAGGIDGAVVEFGALDGDTAEGSLSDDDCLHADDAGADDVPQPRSPIDTFHDRPLPTGKRGKGGGPADDACPWAGPEIEIVFDGAGDPFAEYFTPDPGSGVERCVVRGPDDFATRRHVASREGAALARRLPAEVAAPAAPSRPADPVASPEPGPVSAADDADMLVIEEDLWMPPPREGVWPAIPVRMDDCRRLFSRLRRGDRGE